MRATEGLGQVQVMRSHLPVCACDGGLGWVKTMQGCSASDCLCVCVRARGVVLRACDGGLGTGEGDAASFCLCVRVRRCLACVRWRIGQVKAMRRRARDGVTVSCQSIVTSSLKASVLCVKSIEEVLVTFTSVPESTRRRAISSDDFLMMRSAL
jgi:hypothetical protein